MYHIPVCSHYSKVIIDAIFGKENFVNEIILRYEKRFVGKYTFQRSHDVFLSLRQPFPCLNSHLKQTVGAQAKSRYTQMS